MTNMDWITDTSRSLGAQIPQTHECMHHVTEHLSALLLERLPDELGAELLALLPEEARKLSSLQTSGSRHGETSIGFPEFVNRARSCLGLTSVLDTPPYRESEHELDKLATLVADRFLWSVAQEWPAQIKTKLVACLPGDLRSRMNLYSVTCAESRVV